MTQQPQLQGVWKNLRHGDPVKVIKDVYHRMDGTPWGGVYYAPPGKVIVKEGMIGRFIAKSPTGFLVHLDSGSGSVLGLILDEHAIEKYVPPK